MSKLYLSESGRVIPTLCEELTTFRRARKVLALPPTRQAATLYVLAMPHPEATAPLHVSVNGALADVAPLPSAIQRWWEVPLAPDVLRAGENRFEFWTDCGGMTGWSLALEPGHADPLSYLSDDGGARWRNHGMGYLNAVRGEYVVRVRLAEGEDPAPPPIVWEDPANPRLASLRQVIPGSVHAARGVLGRAQALASWLAASWEHTDMPRAVLYTPWDAETILAWGRAQRGHAGLRPAAMCVHFGVTFVTCCQALGIPARGAALLGTPNGDDGHFVAEVWSQEHGRWVVVDPNLDATFWLEGQPLGLADVRRAGDDLTQLVRWGSGNAFQRQFPHIAAFIEGNLLKGVCFRHRSVWSRADFLSRPELTPPGHGDVAYCETGLVWEEGDRERGFGMFPYFAPASYFDAPPDFPA